MRLNIKIKMNSTKQIVKDHRLDKKGRVTEHLRDTIYRLYEPYVPRENGNLYRQVTYPNNHSIKHIMPYSHYMYKGKKSIGASRPKGIKRKISNKTLQYQGAPKRGPEWDKRMMNDRRREVCKDIENFIKRGGK
ncbi:MAG: hypothetical protein HFJ53_00995 [Clostridia bacterium]|jgi:hypothetical protein|nr:hypothetical protein [Clostridia bacterium]